MSLANAILLAGISAAAGAVIAFIVAVWLTDREIAVWVAHTETERRERIECQTRHAADNDAHGAMIAALEQENQALAVELETIRHGRYVPRSIGPRVVA